MKTEKRKAFVKKTLVLLILIVVSAFVWVPLWMVVTGAFMGEGELLENLSPVLSQGEGTAYWPVFAAYPTLKPAVELLLDSPNFFVMFWNSVKQVFPLLAGQFLIGVPGAWAFARFRFPYKKLLFTLYVVLMLMPFQVTMISSYLVLEKANIMNTHWAVILPAAFSTFPVFIMVKFFSAIPKSFLEAAALDGANEFQIFWRIGIPMGAPGILSAMVLGFLEYWNAIEQPLTFLTDKSKWPLSLYLPNIAADKAGVSLAASVVMMVPALLIFLYGQRYLEEGIRASGLKE